MIDRTTTWNHARPRIEGLIAAMRREFSARAPRAVDRLRMAAPIVVRRSKRPARGSGPFGLLCALLVGALLAYFGDRDRGEARRQMGKDRIAAAASFGIAQGARFSRLARSWRGPRSDDLTTALAAAETRARKHEAALGHEAALPEEHLVSVS